jgi:hypothetical protein
MTKMAKTTGLIAHLRHWGLNVEEEPGWRGRGRPFSFDPKAIIAHHTASGRTSGNFASLRIVRDGRSDLPGPLCQFLLGRDGTVRVIAGGYANHAGTGGPRAGVPANLGNSHAYGIEAENNGTGEPWAPEMLNAYYRLCAALMDWMGTRDVSKVFGHKEWTTRKIDPAGISMDQFRSHVQTALSQGPSVVTVHLSRLKPGKRNDDVLRVKRHLVRRGFENLDTSTNYFGAGLKAQYAKFQRSLGYSGDDADGLPGKTSLQRLGFRVVD